MRSPSILSALVLLALAGCNAKPKYQGDTVLGSFAFTASQPPSESCSFGSSTSITFQFTGVFSYDSSRQVLFLDTDGNHEDDHTGTISGTHFVLNGSGLRDIGCGSSVTIDEVLEGDLYPSSFSADGGCAALLDGGAPTVGDGGLAGLNPVLACGQLRDTARAVTLGDGGTCGGCTLNYNLEGVRQ